MLRPSTCANFRYSSDMNAAEGTEITATFSDLLRTPNEVVDAAERGEVRLTRRDHDDLLLMSAKAARRCRHGVEYVTLIAAAALADPAGEFVDRLRLSFPWVGLLNSDEQTRCASDLLETARACAAVGSYEPLAVLVAQWRSTARMIADGIPRDGSDIDWLPQPVPVPRPA